MSDLEDFDLRKPEPNVPEEPSEPPPLPGPEPRRLGVWIAAACAVLLAVLAIGGYLLTNRPAPPRVGSIQASAPPTSIGPSPTPEPSPIALPALDESDAIVRQLAQGLSAHPQLGEWLGVQDLVRRVTGAVLSVADGESPRATLDFLAPKGSFTVVAGQGRASIDPRSYARYDGFAEVVASVDAAKCAVVYRQLAPLFDAAVKELGFPEGGFSRPLGRAARVLLKTPIPEGGVAVHAVPKATLLYAYDDPSLEALMPAQKHLLRLGPQNAAKLKAKLRELVAALSLDVS